MKDPDRHVPAGSGLYCKCSVKRAFLSSEAASSGSHLKLPLGSVPTATRTQSSRPESHRQHLIATLADLVPAAMTQVETEAAQQERLRLLKSFLGLQAERATAYSELHARAEPQLPA